VASECEKGDLGPQAALQVSVDCLAQFFVPSTEREGLYGYSEWREALMTSESGVSELLAPVDDLLGTVYDLFGLFSVCPGITRDSEGERLIHTSHSSWQRLVWTPPSSSICAYRFLNQ